MQNFVATLLPDSSASRKHSRFDFERTQNKQTKTTIILPNKWHMLFDFFFISLLIPHFVSLANYCGLTLSKSRSRLENYVVFCLLSTAEFIYVPNHDWVKFRSYLHAIFTSTKLGLLKKLMFATTKWNQVMLHFINRKDFDCNCGF